MDKKIFNLFLSHESERAWLDRMGEGGYLLTKKSKGFYYFEHHKNCKFHYSVEYLDSPLEADSTRTYVAQRKSANIALCLVHKGWAYFARANSPIEQNSLIANKNSVFYFWRMFYQFFFGLWAVILTGYHMFAITYLERASQTGTGLIRFYMGESSIGLVKLLARFVNVILDVLNLYLKIWVKAFGPSDAIAVIAFALPIAVILVVLGAINLDNYLSCKEVFKKNAK